MERGDRPPWEQDTPAAAAAAVVPPTKPVNAKLAMISQSGAPSGRSTSRRNVMEAAWTPKDKSGDDGGGGSSGGGESKGSDGDAVASGKLMNTFSLKPKKLTLGGAVLKKQAMRSVLGAKSPVASSKSKAHMPKAMPSFASMRSKGNAPAPSVKENLDSMINKFSSSSSSVSISSGIGSTGSMKKIASLSRGKVARSRKIQSRDVFTRMGYGIKVATLSSGDSFGELSLMTATARNASIVAKGKTFLLRLKKSAFDEMISQKNRGAVAEPQDVQAILEQESKDGADGDSGDKCTHGKKSRAFCATCKKIVAKGDGGRGESDRRAVALFLQSCRFLQNFREAVCLELVDCVTLERFDTRGELVFEQGQLGDKVYIVLSGAIGVYVQKDETSMRMSMMRSPSPTSPREHSAVSPPGTRPGGSSRSLFGEGGRGAGRGAGGRSPSPSSGGGNTGRKLSRGDTENLNKIAKANKSSQAERTLEDMATFAA